MTVRVFFAVSALLAACAPAAAADIVWSVVNPFRFYRHERSFEPHRQAFDSIVKENDGKVPADIVTRIERRLNDPKCENPANYDQCWAEATKQGENYGEKRLGWASQSYGSQNSCYRSFDGVYRYPKSGESCERDISRGARQEDYVKPEWHAIRARLADSLAAAGAGTTCHWTFSSAGEAADVQNAPCGGEVAFDKVPYPAGGELLVADQTGAVLAREPIVVQDLLVVGMGDSYASGEGNPDVPIKLEPAPFNTSYGSGSSASTGLPVRSTVKNVLPSENLPLDAATAYYDARARWTSPDCHRSQYSYQFRVALELALEDPHRAVTLIHLACSGADTWEGVFNQMDAREFGPGEAPKVRSQIEALSELLCENFSATGKTFRMSVPVTWGKAPVTLETTQVFHPCLHRKRDIDLLMLSLGGNDVGFSGLVGYTIMRSDGDVLPIAGFAATLTGTRKTFKPVPAYLSLLRGRLLATKQALQDLFEVGPEKIVQTDYENIAVDQTNRPCSGVVGLDVVKRLEFRVDRIDEVLAFSRRFLETLLCETTTDPTCDERRFPNPTGFHYVKTEPQFDGRGVCAAGSAEEKRNFVVPRSSGGSGFSPYQPPNYAPYAHRQRLFVSPDDSYMTANTQLDAPRCQGGFLHDITLCPPLTDEEQLLSAALYGGAFHRTAEAHAIVADAVLTQWARALVGSH